MSVDGVGDGRGGAGPGEAEPGAAAIGWICIDAADPEALARWWSHLVGGDLSVDADGDVTLAGGSLPLVFLHVSDAGPSSSKNRLHLDLRVTDYEAAVARALALGATAADDVYRGERWRVLRDPDGNEFCIIRPG
jgi:predicted enzyme related to lactoylglutathione lyase